MKRFLSSVKFKVLVCLLVLMAGFMAYAGANGRWSAAPQELLATALVPFQELGRLISGGIQGLRDRTVAVDQVMSENDSLREQLNQLREQMVDYDDMKAENELYRSYYKIEDAYSDYQLVSAFVIGRDPIEKYYSFTIDRGRRDGISVDDVVIAAEGVVGRITAVGYNYAEVLTVLDPEVSMGCTVSRTRDIGLAEGDSSLVQQSRLKMSYLPRETLVTSGDLVVTTGLGGVFPAGLIVGTVEDVRTESSGKSMYAVVAPTADIQGLTSVFVITGYQSADSETASAGADASAAESSSGTPAGSADSAGGSGSTASDSTAASAADETPQSSASQSAAAQSSEPASQPASSAPAVSSEYSAPPAAGNGD